MIALEQARQHLETLGLEQAVEVLDNTLDAAANRQLPYPEMLAELLGVEVAARRERYLTTRTRLAHLPFQRTLEQFDFAFQPSIDERMVKELANLAFVAEATNVLLLGPPGVGKTHLAIGPGPQGHRQRPRRLLRPRLRPDGRPQEGQSRAQPGPADESLPGAQGTRRGTNSASGPTTESRPPHSSLWCPPATNVAASSSLRTRASASGVNCRATA